MDVRIGCRHAAVAALAWMGVAAAISPASSQPSPEQQSAIRGNCRSDYMSNCASVKPGGIEALQCLQRNVAKLSPACQSAVTAVTPKPAAPQQAKPAAPPAPAPAPVTAAAPPAAAPAAAPVAPVRTTTAPAAAKPAAASPPPRQVAKPPAKPAPTLAAAPADLPPIAAPSPAQQSAIRFACRADYATCRGVQPGGALACLQRAPNLSEDCRTALAAMSSDAPTSRANTPTGEPRRPIGPIRRAIRDRMTNQ